jgi:hypothetical protein
VDILHLNLADFLLVNLHDGQVANL